MPSRKSVESLTQISINSLSRLIIRVLDPQFQHHLFERLKIETEGEDIGKLGDEPHKLESDFKKDDANLGDVAHKLQNNCTKEKKVEEYLLCLVEYLTSHAHCSLQEDLFWSVLGPINRLYMKHRSKDLRRLIRKIVPHFINASLKTFDFGSFKMLTEEAMFQEIYTRLKEAHGLEKLTFGRSCYWRAGLISNLSEFLLKIDRLQVLHIHYICNPKMLEGLPESCPYLREVSLKGSKEITNEEVPTLCRFVNLETLDISGTSVTGGGCRNLLLKLPKLMWLTHCPFNCNSDTLIFESRAKLFNYIKDQLQKQPAFNTQRSVASVNMLGGASENSLRNNATVESLNEEPLTLKLKNFWLFNASTEEVFLAHLCPDLEFLRLDFVMQDLPEHPDVESIRHLPRLSSLALYVYDRCPIQLVTNVIEVTSRLTTLHLHLGDEWFFVAPLVNVIAQCCQNLVHLTMEGDYKGQHSLEESDSRLDFTLPVSLNNLKEVRIAGCVTDMRLLHLLSQAPNMQIIRLDGELEWLHDDTITEAINQNLLLNLKEFWFNVSAGVTFSSVKRLLQAENKLQRIGRLCLMSSATKEGYIELLAYSRMHNLSTELIWVTDQRELVKCGNH